MSNLYRSKIHQNTYFYNNLENIPSKDKKEESDCYICQTSDGIKQTFCECKNAYHKECLLDLVRNTNNIICSSCKHHFSLTYVPYTLENYIKEEKILYKQFLILCKFIIICLFLQISFYTTMKLSIIHFLLFTIYNFFFMFDEKTQYISTILYCLFFMYINEQFVIYLELCIRCIQGGNCFYNTEYNLHISNTTSCISLIIGLIWSYILINTTKNEFSIIKKILTRQYGYKIIPIAKH